MAAVRVGIVGTQFAARFHWEGLSRVYGVPVEIVGVTSRTADSRERFARSKGIRSFATFEDLCDAVDVVDHLQPSIIPRTACSPGAQSGKACDRRKAVHRILWCGRK
jgi:hypothetical protein